jgi:hypothetical protein
MKKVVMVFIGFLALIGNVAFGYSRVSSAQTLEQNSQPGYGGDNSSDVPSRGKPVVVKP